MNNTEAYQIKLIRRRSFRPKNLTPWLWSNRVAITRLSLVTSYYWSCWPMCRRLNGHEMPRDPKRSLKLFRVHFFFNCGLPMLKWWLCFTTHWILIEGGAIEIPPRYISMKEAALNRYQWQMTINLQAQVLSSVTSELWMVGAIDDNWIMHMERNYCYGYGGGYNGEWSHFL